MNKWLNVFLTILTIFIALLIFWEGIFFLKDDVEKFIFWCQVGQAPQDFSAQTQLKQTLMEERLESLKPIRDWKIEELEIEAKSAISVLISDEGKEKILFENNAEQKLPIASLTKLMTALIVLENYDLSKEIKISEEATKQEGDFGKLKAGGVFQIKYLLYPLLMESSNDAAYALAENYEARAEGTAEENFVELMNSKAQEIELKDTFFINPSGLDPELDPESEHIISKIEKDISERKINYSTATDLVKFTKEELLEEPLIWEILSTLKFSSYGPELANTNALLYEDSLEWRDRINGGKTGYTDKANDCILLVVQAQNNRGYLVNIILGAEDRFEEMKKLVGWTEKAYLW